MALIKCPECGREISDKASACIHCGCPISASAPAGSPRSLSVNFHAVLSGEDGESTPQNVFVEELGRKVEFPLDNDTKEGETIKITLREGSKYDYILFTAASVYRVPKATSSSSAAHTPVSAPVSSPSNTGAIEIIKNYKRNWFAEYVYSRRYYTILILCLGLFIKLAADGQEEYIPMCIAITSPLWLISLLGRMFYPMYHVKKYFRKYNIEEAIRNDTGYMNVAISAYNANPSKKMLAYIKGLNMAAGLRIEQQLAAKKNK